MCDITANIKVPVGIFYQCEIENLLIYYVQAVLKMQELGGGNRSSAVATGFRRW